MTSVTTAAGMASFVTSEMAAIKDLGTARPDRRVARLRLHDGALACVARDLSAAARGNAVGSRPRGASLFERPGRSRATSPPAHRGAMLPATGIVFASSAVWDRSQITLSHNGLTWFPEDEPMRRAISEIIDGELGGAISMEIVIDSGRRTGSTTRRCSTSDRARGLRDREPRGRSYGRPRPSRSSTSSKETHQALNENRPEFYAIPRDHDLVAQELLLFENSGSDDLEELVDSSFARRASHCGCPSSTRCSSRPFLERGATRVLEKRSGPGMSKVRDHGVDALLAEAIFARDRQHGALLRLRHRRDHAADDAAAREPAARAREHESRICSRSWRCSP